MANFVASITSTNSLLKTISATIALMILSFTGFANSNDKELLISQVLEVSEPSAGNVSPVDRAAESTVQESQEVSQSAKSEVDSSYYSVNKFNFLFYLMYKLKYSEETPEEIVIE